MCRVCTCTLTSSAALTLTQLTLHANQLTLTHYTCSRTSTGCLAAERAPAVAGHERHAGHAMCRVGHEEMGWGGAQ